MEEPEFRVGPGQLQGWSTRDGKHVASFLERAELTANKSRSLKWIVDPYKKTPVWLQLILLWIKHRLLRRPISND